MSAVRNVRWFLAASILGVVVALAFGFVSLADGDTAGIVIAAVLLVVAGANTAVYAVRMRAVSDPGRPSLPDAEADEDDSAGGRLP